MKESLSDRNGIRTHERSASKQKPNDFAKLAIWCSFYGKTYIYGVFGCVFLSCNIRFLMKDTSDIHTIFNERNMK